MQICRANNTSSSTTEQEEIEQLLALIIRPVGGTDTDGRLLRYRGGSGNGGCPCGVAEPGADPRSATMGVIGKSVVATTGSTPTDATVRRGQAKSSARPAGTGNACWHSSGRCR